MRILRQGWKAGPPPGLGWRLRFRAGGASGGILAILGGWALHDWGARRQETSACLRVGVASFLLRRAVGLGLACTVCVPALTVAERLLFSWARLHANYVWFGWTAGLFVHLILGTLAASVAAQGVGWQMGILRCRWAWVAATVANVALFLAIQRSMLVWY
jgi:hypothetical protein